MKTKNRFAIAFLTTLLGASAFAQTHQTSSGKEFQGSVWWSGDSIPTAVCEGNGCPELKTQKDDDNSFWKDKPNSSVFVAPDAGASYITLQGDLKPSGITVLGAVSLLKDTNGPGYNLIHGIVLGLVYSQSVCADVNITQDPETNGVIAVAIENNLKKLAETFPSLNTYEMYHAIVTASSLTCPVN